MRLLDALRVVGPALLEGLVHDGVRQAPRSPPGRSQPAPDGCLPHRRRPLADLLDVAQPDLLDAVGEAGLAEQGETRRGAGRGRRRSR
ncbi:hypothetical protein G5V59_07600 [Nocardioides sp. W3-2-3]|uniref:hypothetical protein n=1 Tax=Nocardioides convexus TaxID=2712224 RepID=UPI0024186C11|nr:hypothetical protein [Nocardioides convexus]NHA00088.1 hypothetical protein [Nocardioides convexus]